jgi:hypothetical protein
VTPRKSAVEEWRRQDACERGCVIAALEIDATEFERFAAGRGTWPPSGDEVKRAMVLRAAVAVLEQAAPVRRVVAWVVRLGIKRGSGKYVGPLGVPCTSQFYAWKGVRRLARSIALDVGGRVVAIVERAR